MRSLPKPAGPRAVLHRKEVASVLAAHPSRLDEQILRAKPQDD